MLWIEDSTGKALVDLTAAAIENWWSEAGPKVREFLSTGTADAELVKEMVSELKKHKTTKPKFDLWIRKILKECKPPIRLE